MTCCMGTSENSLRMQSGGGESKRTCNISSTAVAYDARMRKSEKRLVLAETHDVAGYTDGI
jgi:hypothetical protein